MTLELPLLAVVCGNYRFKQLVLSMGRLLGLLLLLSAPVVELHQNVHLLLSALMLLAIIVLLLFDLYSQMFTLILFLLYFLIVYIYTLISNKKSSGVLGFWGAIRS